MKVLHSVHPDDFKTYQTALIRERFLADGIVKADEINCVYTHYDRMIVGGVNPVSQPIELENYANLRAEYFLERREIGIINVGNGAGTITADGVPYDLNKLDCLYIGKGAKQVTFAAKDAANPPVFYLLSAPAHKTYPITLMTNEQAVKVNAGDITTANHRTINKYIHLEGIQSCQLVMGLTILHGGSVWNTMPPHVHDRRMEAYFYFDVPQGQRIFHYMGEGTETRHILMDNYDAVVSPPWSIHSGVGTASYSFIWGMAGENLDYTDMDALSIPEIR
ncbi:5-dehydro-4-deoxy-D-glucuronate isomerase [Mucilaginibacter polytrichastri]|uniref:4-deoxy-L-threo-5-hexosulose-uronate ketol-isomerase n=1 Tax=Mucilaginibacter polytrichastri TaxID=1302689 RepID=A0A1Q6A0U5_9SPHI|nr:5-dehydro-4-deoxy-D-glucuronate isomerase [Mucilaginibacter polytrichastri]OKS87640.1 4-deoxy-L-threo-5-hexosulose-uronate ketol-isomerase [Mucilaginibacter polytrichastri]SFS93183.1 4-deoxy-L-threo-5-hexulose uronate isomerase [Mucilaginibacter polytrichastri]